MNKTLTFALASGAVMMAMIACVATRQGQNISTNPPALQPTQPVSNTSAAATATQSLPTAVPAATQAPAQPSPTLASGPSQSSNLAQQLDSALSQLGGSLQSQDTLNDEPSSPEGDEGLE